MKEHELINYWINEVIVKLNLCPFAKPSIDNNSFFNNHSPNKDFDQNLKDFIRSLDQLMDSEKLTNGILYFPNWELDFFNFLDFFASCEELIDDLEIEDQVQLVIFHPEFIFENTKFDERCNYVNRSPYPLIHLIKTEEMDRAIENEKMGKDISFNNEKKLNELSEKEFKKIFHYLKVNE